MALDCHGKLVFMRLKSGVIQKYEKLVDPKALAAFIGDEGSRTVYGCCVEIGGKGVWVAVKSFPAPAEQGTTELLAGAYLVPWEDVEEVFVADRKFQVSRDFALGYVRK